MNDIKIVEDELCRVHPCVNDLDAVRQLILMDMAFNMGVPRLCKFKKMWAAIHEQRFDICLLYTSPSPRDQRGSRMPSSA